MSNKIPINQKLGYNMRFHPDYDGQKAYDFVFQKLKHAGTTYIRLYSNVEKFSFDADVPKMYYLYQNVEEVSKHGFTPVLPVIIDYPEKAQDINASWNTTHCRWSDTLISQFKRFFKEVVQHIEGMGIHVIYEAYNEAPGAFWSSYGYSYHNQTTINSYMDMNDYMRRTVYQYSTSEFIELCSTGWPGQTANHSIYSDKQLTQVLSTLNTRYGNLVQTEFDKRADYISYHPYMEQGFNNGAPEILLKEGTFNDYPNLKDIPMSWTEFGFSHGKEWAGVYPPCTKKALMMRQIIIGDYIGCDMMIPYTARLYNNMYGGTENIYNWGNLVRTTQDGVDSFQFDETGQGVFEICSQLKSYHLNRNITIDRPITESNYLSMLYAFEYENDEGKKKLVYWTPMSQPCNKTITWNDQEYNLTFKYEPQFLEERSVADESD